MRDDRNGKNSGDVRERIEEREESGVERTSRQRGERVGSLFAPTSLTEARASRLKEIGRSAAKKKIEKKNGRRTSLEGREKDDQVVTVKSCFSLVDSRLDRRYNRENVSAETDRGFGRL